MTAPDPGTLRARLERLETHYDFQCEGGPLALCVEWQQLKAEIDRLTTERERTAHLLSESNGEPTAAILSAISVLREAKDAAERQVRALQGYVQHKMDCWLEYKDDPEPSCTCGLDAALGAIPPQET